MPDLAALWAPAPEQKEKKTEPGRDVALTAADAFRAQVFDYLRERTQRGSTMLSWDQKELDEAVEKAAKLEKDGKLEDAAKAHQAAAKIYQKQYNYSEYSGSEWDKPLAHHLNQASKLLALSGKYDAAIEHQLQVRKIITKQYDYSDYLKTPYDESMIKTGKRLAALYDAKGDLHKAAEEYQKLNDIIDRKYYASHRYPRDFAKQILENHTALADLYTRQNKPKQAIDQLHIVLQMHEYSFDKPDTTKIRECREQLATMYGAAGKPEMELYMRKQIYTELKERGADGKRFDEARVALARACEKMGKNLDAELRADEIKDYEARDLAEKGAFFLNKLPRKLEFSFKDGQFKVASDGFGKLAALMPGSDMKGFLFKELTSEVKDANDRRKSVEDLTAFLDGLQSVSIKAAEKQVELKSAQERTISMKLHPSFEGVVIAPELSFNFAGTKGDTSKLEFTNVKGLQISALNGAIKIDIGGLAVVDERQSDGSVNRVVQVTTVDRKSGKQNAMRFTVSANVPKDQQEVLGACAEKMEALSGAVAGSNINGVLDAFGFGKLDESLAKIATNFNSFRKNGGEYELNFKSAQSLDLSQFGAPMPGSINLGSKISFYRSAGKYDLDLSSIEGVDLHLDGDVKRVNSGKPLDTKLKELRIGGLTDRGRGISLATDNLIYRLMVDLDANWKPVPNSSGYLRMTNPLVGKKTEGIHFKFDGNGQPAISKEEVLYLVLEGGRSKVYDWMESIIK